MHRKTMCSGLFYYALKKFLTFLILFGQIDDFCPERSRRDRKMMNEILRLKNTGLSYKEISNKLNLSIGTVKSIISRNKGKEPVNTCKYCGNEIANTPHKKAKMFCSKTCKNKWWNKNRQSRNSKTKVEVTCVCCGKKFYDYAWRGRRYCCSECYKKVRYGR